MKNLQAAQGILYSPVKWETAEFKIINYFKAAVKEIFGMTIPYTSQPSISGSDMEKKAQEIEQLKLDLIRKDEQLKTISYHQSHTVRRPLANIMGIADLVAHYRVNPVDEDFFKLIELLKVSTGELDDVIKNNL